MRNLKNKLVRFCTISVVVLIAIIFFNAVFTTIAWAVDEQIVENAVDISCKAIIYFMILAAIVIVLVLEAVVYTTVTDRLSKETIRADQNGKAFREASAKCTKLTFEIDTLNEALERSNIEIRKLKGDRAIKEKENEGKQIIINKQSASLKEKNKELDNLNGKIYDFESRVIALEAEKDILSKKLDIASAYYPHLEEEIEEAIRQEEDSFNRYVAEQFDEEYSDTMYLEPASSNIAIICMAIDDYYELTEEQVKYVFVDIERLMRVRNQSMDILNHEKASKITKVIEAELGRKDHGTEERLPYLYAIMDRLDSMGWDAMILLDLQMLNMFHQYIAEGEAERKMRLDRETK